MGDSVRVLARLARNVELRRVLTAYALFTVCEFGFWIAMLVFAYDQGGVGTAGFVAFAQLLPSAFVAALVGPVADRWSPAAVLFGGYVVQAVGAAVTAAVLLTGGPPLAAYAGAVVVSCAIPTSRPAQTAMLPALATEARELTAANVVVGWVESLSVLVAGLATGVALGFGSPGSVFAVGVLLLLAACLLLLPLLGAGRGRGVVPDGANAVAGSDARAALRLDRPIRFLVGLLGLEYVVIGAMDVLFVVIAIDLLRAGAAWTGYLNTAYGAGALLIGSLGALFVGKRLGPLIALSALAAGMSLGATAFAGQLMVVVLLALLGGGRALFDMAVRVLLQRAAGPEVMARVFGLAEGLSMLGLAAGAVLAPALVSLAGAQFALVMVSAILPVAVLARLFFLVHLDEHARIPLVEVTLLRQIPLFQQLPAETLEGLANSLVQVGFEAGSELVREGEEGDCYYAIAAGAVEIRQRGHLIAVLHRGEGLGEIALLAAVPRTATAVAQSPVVAFRLEREPFLTALTGHVPSFEVARAVVSDLQERDAKRRPPPPAGRT